MKEAFLVDLSSIAYPIWHNSASEPNPDHASIQIVARVRALTSGHDHVAICCDAGRSFRKDLDASYKGNRPEKDATLVHQITLAIERLIEDGLPVWRVPGFEADDLIATATTRALALPDTTVLIVTADKDLMQLIGPRVTMKKATTGELLDVEAVGVKFGVRPDQMCDYLTLVGDVSDNVKGAVGVGAKTAAALLAKHGSIDAIYDGLKTKGAAAMGIGLAVAKSLTEFEPQYPKTKALITLRTDVEIPFDELTRDRTAVTEDDPAEAETVEETATQAETMPSAAPAPAAERPRDREKPTAIARREPELLGPAPAEWERGLDPRTLTDARMLSEDMFKSRMFSAYGTKEGVLSTVMVGRELGLPAMASLRSIHVIEGRHSLSAAIMVALVLKSGMAEYFEPLEFTDQLATFETKRHGARNPVKLTYTFEMARKAQLVKPNSNWDKNPMAMCIARAQAMLCRLVYPDLLAGLYTPEELADRQSDRELVA